MKRGILDTEVNSMWFKRRMKAASDAEEHIDPLSASRLPVLIWLGLVATATLILQTMTAPIIIPSVFFVIVMLAHSYFYWITGSVVAYSKPLYIIIQAILIYGSAILMPDGMPAILIGLIPVLIGQTVAIYFETAKVVFIAFVLYVMFCSLTLFNRTGPEAALLVLLLLLMMVVVISYASLFYKQVNARVRTQNFLRELELAHQKVEELTLTGERQRMARDLHDTLAQGLAGIIMQLEAASIHQEKGNQLKAQEIIRNAMVQARQSLADARRAIDDLRTKSNPSITFSEAFQEQLERFRQATGITTEFQGELSSQLSKVQMEHILHILSESLMNIARHAQANLITVTTSQSNNKFNLNIVDNGQGFNTGHIGKLHGHYGLIGIQERARLIGGSIEIESNEKGTTVHLSVPL
ncbi:sensor histidine kinase [Paenibacillus polysaccharolyticus]|uniref:sensor histidine kinase n=2 Tax=Paenibacillus polysaccharolyticus TaxID=582692 RepID=UPI003AE78D72